MAKKLFQDAVNRIIEKHQAKKKRGTIFIPAKRRKDPTFDYVARQRSPESNLPPRWLQEDRLPHGAIGKDAHGRPYYGGSGPLDEWFRGASARWNAPLEDIDAGSLVVKQPVPDNVRMYRGASSSINLGATWDRLVKWINNWGGDETGKPTLPTYFGRTISEGVNYVGALFQEGAEQAERGIGAFSYMVEAGVTDAGEKEMRAPLKSKDISLGERLLANTPVGALYYAGKFMTSKRSWAEKKRIIEDGYNAGRVLYTSVIDPAVRAEYIRRYRDDNENPYLLQHELMNPVAEFVGQFVLDPANLLGSGAAKARQLRRIDDAKETFYAVPKAMEAVMDGLDSLDDVQRAQRMHDLAEVFKVERTAVVSKLSEFAKSHGIAQLTATGKRFVTQREMSLLSDFVYRSVGKDMDEMGEVLLAMARTASDDVNEIYTGLNVLQHFGPTWRPFITKPGMRMGHILRKVMANEDGIIDGKHFIDALKKAQKGGADELATFMGKRVDSVIDDMFPTIKEMMDRGEEVSPTLRALARFHDRFYERGPYKFFNTIFAGVYMGMSPGYAFRNAWTNAFQAFVDEGAGAVYLPGVTPKATWERAIRANGGRDLVGAAGYVAEAGGGESIAQVVKGGIPGVMLRVSEVFEKNAARQIMGKVFTDTMRKIADIDRDLALPSLERVIAAGMPPDAARHLKALVIANDYDVNKAYKEFVRQAKTGEVDIFRSGSWLSAAERKDLDEFRLMDEIGKTIAESLDKTTAQNRIRKIFEDLFAEGKKVVNDVSTVSKDNEAVEVAQNLAEVRKAGDFTDEELELAQDFLEANHQSNMAFMEAIQRANSDGIRTLAMQGKDGLSIVNSVLRKVRISFGNEVYTAEDLIQGGFGMAAKRASDDLTSSTWRHSRNIDLTSKRDELEKIWKEAGLQGAMPDIKSDIKRELWNNYNKVQRTFWQNYREQYAQLAAQAIQELADATGVQVDLERAQFYLQRAKKFDKFLSEKEVWLDLSLAIRRKNNAAIARSYAHQFDIPTATAEGKPLDNTAILNIINKQSNTKYAKLEDVPGSVSHDALMRHALGEKAPETYRIGITNVKGREKTNIDELLDNALAEGNMEEYNRLTQEALKPGIDYIQETNRPFRVKTEVTHARFNKTPEPSIYATAQVGEDGLEELLYRTFKAADEQFGQHAAMVYSPLKKSGQKLGDTKRKSGLVGRIEPALDMDFAAELSDDQIRLLDEIADEVGLAGFTVKPDKKGIEIVRVSWYSQDYGTAEEFAEQLGHFIQRANERGLGATPQQGFREVWFAAADASGDAGKAKGAYGYSDYYSYFETAFPKQARRSKDRLSKIPYQAGQSNTPPGGITGGKTVTETPVGAISQLDPKYIKPYQSVMNQRDYPIPDLETYFADNPNGGLVYRRTGKDGFEEYLVVHKNPEPKGGEYRVSHLKPDQEPTGHVAGDINKVSEYIANAFPNKPGEFKNTTFEFLGEVYDDLPKAPQPPAPKMPPDVKPYAGGTPSWARTVYESTPRLEQLRDRILRGVDDNWGKVQKVPYNEDVTKLLGEWAKEATGRIETARLVSNQVAIAARDFALHAYPAKRNFDLVASYVFPYHYWYTRTYAKWMRRLVEQPHVWSGYFKYKEALSRIHGDQPEWLRYSLNSDELLGIDTENPVIFNLEQMIFPLNGLLGVDFDDPKKRVNLLTSWMDDMSKFGPSVWTPFQIAIAASLYHQGEQEALAGNIPRANDLREASARWARRLIPQTALIKSLTAVLGVKPGGLELDPNVLIFADGLDIYDQRRVGKALYAMVNEGLVTEAEAEEAMYLKTGPYWDQAKQRAATGRFGQDLVSFMLGVNFRYGTEDEQQIGVMDDYLHRLYEMEHNLSPDEFSDTLSWIRQQFPFYDLIMLSRKSEEERDRAYAYSVIGRIPPGQSDDLAKAVGISYDLVKKFRDEKGQIWKWQTAEREKFMNAIVELGAILEIPDNATKTEWKEAGRLYGEMVDSLAEQFGDDIYIKIDRYEQLRRRSPDAADDYIQDHPEVGDAKQYQNAQIANDPLLTKYYGGIEKTRQYLRGVMFENIEGQLGEDIWEQWDEWSAAKLDGKSYQYWKSHPDLAKYMDMKEYGEQQIAAYLTKIAEHIPERPYPFYRERLPENLTTGQRQVLELQQSNRPEHYSWGWGEWKGVLSRPLQGLLEDHFVRGESLPEGVIDALERVGQPLNEDPYTLLELIGQSLEQ